VPLALGEVASHALPYQTYESVYTDSLLISVYGDDTSQYPIIKAPERGFLVQSPVFGAGLENVAITGEGILDGSGEAWRPVKKFKTTAQQWKKLVNSGGVVNAAGDVWWPSAAALEGEDFLNQKKLSKKKSELTAEDYLPARDYLRPYMVLLIRCNKVLIEDVTIQNSPKFALVPNFCEEVVIRRVKVNNEWWAQNGDGIDINSCKNVQVTHCIVTAGDDGICMKSGPDRLSTGPALQNVVIQNCIVFHGHGGFVIGSNTDGGMKNILVQNCNFIGTDIGLRFKSARDRGGLVENIFIKNIFMKDIVNEAILFTTYYENDSRTATEIRPVSQTTPRFEQFHLDSIYCVGAGQAILIEGLPEMPVRDISIRNVVISADAGFFSRFATGLTLQSAKILPKQGEIFRLAQSTQFLIENGFCPTGTPVFIKIMDNITNNIILKNTNLSSSKNPIELNAGANPAAVILK